MCQKTKTDYNIGMKYLNQIIQGDCIELMKELPEKSIDMILADLPYGETSNPDDIPINLELLWKQYLRISKDNTAVLLFAQGKFRTKLELSQNKHYRYDLIWEKDRPTGFLNSSRMPLRCHEYILVFYKKLPTYNPQLWEGQPQHGRGKKFLGADSSGKNYHPFIMNEDFGKGRTLKHPRSVLRAKRPHPPLHPTQKPIDLCQWLISTYTNEGDIVLDNVVGSGTTAIAAQNINRNYIGFDISEEYCQIARNRLNSLKEM